ncbi:MAG: phosphate/phosphite/phosphonate ABC transporter substrate-binding protein [Pseudonocardia sp.]
MRRPGGALAAAMVIALAVAGCGQSAAPGGGAGAAADPETLVFAAVPSEESTTLQQSYQPIIDLLARETGKKIEFRQATNYTAVIEGQIAGNIHIAQFGPFSYVLARNNGAKISPVGALVDKGQPASYVSYGIVKTGSPITDLAGFAGKKVCFVDPASTSGFLYPSAGLLGLGIDPETGVEPVFAGGHDASVLEVNAGRCDAGFAFDNMVDKELIEAGQIQAGDITTVWKSEPIPSSPLAVLDTLSPELRATIADAIAMKANSDYLLANSLCSGECSISDEGASGYTVVDDAFYEPIRTICEITKTERCTAQ